MLTRLCRSVFLQQKNTFQFGMLDFLSNRSMKKQQQQIKDELEHMALKPIFTINDFKIRTQESLRSLDSEFTSKYSHESKKKKREIEDDIKVLFCLFEDELNINELPNHKKQVQISRITRVPLQDIKALFDRYLQGKMMHKYIRHLTAKNIQLPKTQAQLEKGFTDYYERKKRTKVEKYKTVKQYSRKQRARLSLGEFQAPKYSKK